MQDPTVWAAQRLGMKTREIVSVHRDDLGDRYVVTTHDGQRVSLPDPAAPPAPAPEVVVMTIGHTEDPPLVDGALAAQVPVGTIADVMAWVDGDPGRALAALTVESVAEKPRQGLCDQLNKVRAGV